MEDVKLTTPLRSPPVVAREVMVADEIKTDLAVDGYTTIDVPVSTEGPSVRRITHYRNKSGHIGTWPRDCKQCGLEVALILEELNVGMKRKKKGMRRDVFDAISG